MLISFACASPCRLITPIVWPCTRVRNTGQDLGDQASASGSFSAFWADLCDTRRVHGGRRAGESGSQDMLVWIERRAIGLRNKGHSRTG